MLEKKIELTVQMTVFNPEFIGKAVKIKGYTVDGDKINGVYLVRSVEGVKMTVLNEKCSLITLNLEDFDEKDKDALKIKVLS